MYLMGFYRTIYMLGRVIHLRLMELALVLIGQFMLYLIAPLSNKKFVYYQSSLKFLN